MGLGLFRCSSDPSTPMDPKKSIPNKHKYLIKKHIYSRRFLILEVNYPGCPNYGGDKILVFEGVTLEQLLAFKGGIDPHFGDGVGLFPVMRFPPTREWWRKVIRICRALEDEV